jgi:hypothetical protein
MARTRSRPASAPPKPQPAAAATASEPPRRRPRSASGGEGGALRPAERTPAALTEEEAIESAKYLARELPARVFEEERFLFPESYGEDRLRLLVKDPYWLFAHWDLNPGSLSALRAELGERAMALSRLTLRVGDARSGGAKTILLPEGARSWYVETDGESRSFRGELGLTLPSGKFRKLAESNTVVTPRLGPSARLSALRARFGSAAGQAAAEAPATATAEGAPGPWGGEAGPAWSDAASRTDRGLQPPAGRLPERGGASDAFRGGASDTFRR